MHSMLVSNSQACFPVPPAFTDEMRLNGALDGQPPVKKRRGRRKNVEGMDLLFMNRNQATTGPNQVIAFYFTFLLFFVIWILVINPEILNSVGIFLSCQTCHL